jgi:hypothetical protein
MEIALSSIFFSGRPLPIILPSKEPSSPHTPAKE